jgi:two-component system, chemotaxis family, chemotaxis protein CheY
MSQSHRPTIVIADDDGATRTLLRLILKNADYNVVAEALDGESALALCAQHKPDLICLDVMMPKLTGIAALKAIKAKFPDMAVLMVTSDAAMETVKTALQSGAAGYVVKPFKEGKVLDAVAHALHKPAA